MAEFQTTTTHTHTHHTHYRGPAELMQNKQKKKRPPRNWNEPTSSLSSMFLTGQASYISSDYGRIKSSICAGGRPRQNSRCTTNSHDPRTSTDAQPTAFPEHCLRKSLANREGQRRTESSERLRWTRQASVSCPSLPPFLPSTHQFPLVPQSCVWTTDRIPTQTLRQNKGVFFFSFFGLLRNQSAVFARPLASFSF